MPHNEELDGIFRALGDPTRRAILDLLAEQGSLTVSEIAAQFPALVRSGISKHLMALREVRLVYAVKQGREQHYQIDSETMATLFRPWVERYERYWQNRLERLRDMAEALEESESAE